MPDRRPVEQHAEDQENEDHDVEVEVKAAAGEVEHDVGQSHGDNEILNDGAAVEPVRWCRDLRPQALGFCRDRRLLRGIRAGAKTDLFALHTRDDYHAGRSLAPAFAARVPGAGVGRRVRTLRPRGGPVRVERRE